MSTTDFINFGIQEQDDDSQAFNLVKQLALQLKFDNTLWVPNAQIFNALTPITLPKQPTLFMYLRNLGPYDLGVELFPSYSGTGPVPLAADVNLVKSGGFLACYFPAGAGSSIAGGPFPSGVSGGINSLFLQSNTSDPNASSVVEYFLGG